MRIVLEWDGGQRIMQRPDFCFATSIDHARPLSSTPRGPRATAPASWCCTAPSGASS